jgi:hypothetical protein
VAGRTEVRTSQTITEEKLAYHILSPFWLEEVAVLEEGVLLVLSNPFPGRASRLTRRASGTAAALKDETFVPCGETDTDGNGDVAEGVVDTCPESVEEAVRRIVVSD